MGKSMTIDQWMRQGHLPLLEMRMLIAHVMDYSRVQLISRGNEVLSPLTQVALDELVERRQAGEPMAYILGIREFYGRDFIVNPAVLIPRPDTELLIDIVLSLDIPANAHVLDLGTGSGAIAVTLACERPNWSVYALDISDDALGVARENASLLSADVHFMQSDWFSALTESQMQFELIVSNPPYIESNDVHLSQGDVRFEPRSALTDEADGLSCYRQLLEQVPRYLKRGGWFAVEHGYDQGRAVFDLFEQAGFEEVATHTDMGGNQRVTLGVYRRRLDIIALDA